MDVAEAGHEPVEHRIRGLVAAAVLVSGVVELALPPVPLGVETDKS